MTPPPPEDETTIAAATAAPDGTSTNSVSDRQATQQARRQVVGQRPGTLVIHENSLKPRLFMISYSAEVFEDREYNSYDELYDYFARNPHLRHWIDVRGYDDLPLMERLMTDFELHPLQMEDVLGDYQRAKVEEFDEGRLFMVSRMTDFTSGLEIDDDQLSLFTGPNYVLSFQDDYDDCLDSVRQRIRSGRSQIMKRPPLYLAYTLTDVVLDHYFPTMAAIGDYIEYLEELIFRSRRADRRLLGRILQIKKDIVRFRRLVYPERDKIMEILRMPDDVVSEEMKVFFRDCYDHSVQALDLAESYKESVNSLVELYLSDQSNRMNEVMKVLTIISSIFIPLSFVVGLYGMNFQRVTPEGKVNPLNMPELYHPLGYPILLAVLFFVVVFQLVYFYRKGWLS